MVERLPSGREEPRRVMYGEQYRNVYNEEAMSWPITEMWYKDLSLKGKVPT